MGKILGSLINTGKHLSPRPSKSHSKPYFSVMKSLGALYDTAHI